MPPADDFGRRVVRKFNRVVVLLAAMSMLGLSTGANAAFFGLPKSMRTNPLDRIELSMPIWGPKAYSLHCIEHLDECQPQTGQPQANLPPPSQPQIKKVALFSLPKALKPEFDRIPSDTPTLGPMAHTVFCLRYPKDCEVKRMAFRGGKFELTPKRLNDLQEVNTRVNRSIRPERNVRGLAGEKWLLAPTLGDCNDYAVTKRHELLARGWPSRTLLLAEVVTHWGEHHLVLVVRTGDGDLVLDSLNPNIRMWSKASYQWVRIQSTWNPKRWSTVRTRSV